MIQCRVYIFCYLGDQVFVLCASLGPSLTMPLLFSSKSLYNPRRISAIDGAPICMGTIAHGTLPITLMTSSLHMEKKKFLVTTSPKHHIIFGIPWLQLHDPIMSWNRCSDYKNCLESPCLSLNATTGKSPDNNIQIGMPTEYQDLMEVFSKKKVTGLPLNCEYDCNNDPHPKNH